MESEISILRSDAPLKTISELLNRNEYIYRYEILDLSIKESNRIVSEYLKIPLATRVLSYKKLRIINDLPCSLEQVYIESEKVLGLEKEDLTNVSLYEKIKELYGYSISKTSEEIKVVKPTLEEKRLLKLDDEEYVSLTTGVSYLDNGSILEYYTLISRYNFFKYKSVNRYE